MKRRSAAVSNDPVAAEAAREQLGAGASAVGAVLAGFFAAAGAHAGVLLGPVTLLVGGVGTGVRAFDGRLRQPGVGAKRPRGVVASAVVPDAARVAVPTAVAALAVALAYDGGKSLGPLVKPGIARAERGGADARAGVLRLVRSAGAGAFHDSGFVRAMLRVAGPSQGGLLSPADFTAVPTVDTEAAARARGSDRVLEAPWAADAKDLELEALGFGCAICAVDVRRVCAALCYRRVSTGFAVEELELEAPLAAVPVMRGVTRITPGEPLPAPAPLAFIADAANTQIDVLATPAASALGPADLDTPALRLRCHLGSGEVETLAGG
ncbi:MAG: hypothetical protein IT377_23470 [Polyangiaceae bacterium]|nr:hypothetical protein [Polyangiaceae bacterium]